MIKAILFDLDGTLIDTNDLILKSFKHTFKTHMNLEVPDEEIVVTFGEPLNEVLQKYDFDNVEDMLKIYRKFNEENHDLLIKGYEGIKEALLKIKEKGIKIAVVTSKKKNTSIRGMKIFDIFDIFDAFVAFEDTEEHKPLPAPVLKACELLEINPKEAIMVGDSHNDILCGRNAGCTTALVKYSVLPYEHLIKFKPDYILEHIEDLLVVIESLNKN